jgi:ATP-dependent Lon protease
MIVTLLVLQMRAIKDELGDNDDDEDDVAALERKMQNAGMPTNIWKHAQRELRYSIFILFNMLISRMEVSLSS